MNFALLSLMIAGFAYGAQDAAADAPITAHYSCTGGPTLHVVFTDGKATVTPSGGQAVTLNQAMTADGFQYSDATHSLRGRGDEATWTVDGGQPLDCTAGDREERG